MRKRDENFVPVSQRDLAAYLRVSPTLLSMATTLRHGSRELAGEVTGKLARLTEKFMEAEHVTGNSPSLKKMERRQAADAEKMLAVLTSQSAYCEARIAVLRRQLHDMESHQQQDEHWLRTVDTLLADLPNNKSSADERIWLQNQQVITMERLQKNGIVAQGKLEMKIGLEKARLKGYSNITKRLSQTL
jgi:hypothetical protein